MKKNVLIIVLMSVVGLNAANVLWNCFTQHKEAGHDVFEYLGYEDSRSPDYLMPSVAVIGTKSGDDVTLSGMSNANAAFIGVWLEKSCGDLIDFSTMYNHDEYFGSAFPGSVPPENNLQKIHTNPGETVYLAVMQSGYNMNDPGGKDYGWIELLVGVNGDDITLTLSGSAMAIDGSPLICGFYGDSIPEPVSWLLLLVGAGLLALRRNGG